MPLSLGLRWGSLLVAPEYRKKIIYVLSMTRIGHPVTATAIKAATAFVEEYLPIAPVPSA